MQPMKRRAGRPQGASETRARLEDPGPVQGSLGIKRIWGTWVAGGLPGHRHSEGQAVI